jgi:hypothetical protein
VGGCQTVPVLVMKWELSAAELQVIMSSGLSSKPSSPTLSRLGRMRPACSRWLRLGVTRATTTNFPVPVRGVGPPAGSCTSKGSSLR